MSRPFLQSLARVLAASFASALLCLPLHAAPVQAPHVEAELVADAAVAVPGSRITIALRLAHEAGWHTYWKNPGDSGMPTRIAWTLPEGVKAGPILWPVPERLPVGPLMNYGYEGEILLLTELDIPQTWPAGQPIPIGAKVDWLICKEVCIPGGTTLSMTLPTGGAATAEPAWARRLQEVRAELPVAWSGATASIDVTDTHIVIRVADGAITRLSFLPVTPDVIDNPSTQRLERTEAGVALELMAAPGFQGQAVRLDGLLVAEPRIAGARAVEVSLPYPGGVPRVKASTAGSVMSAEDIRAAAGRGPGLGLLAALIFAFGGGIVLNLMPCVFPIVSIKILGFVEQAHGDRADLRRHGLAFASGIVICFWAVAGLLIALRASGEALGWGYQLQSPPVVAALAVLFFVLGLNLSGYFEMGATVQSAAGSVRDRNGLAGAFLGGLLATAVATPCTAPFMGAALGYALTQPATEAMLVFTSLALGMALPYVLLSFAPGLARWLPRPGRWMETLKQLLAFPLYLTVVWLVWVLGEQLGQTAAAMLLAGLVLVAAAVWAWRRFSSAAPAAGAISALVLLAGALWLAWPVGEPVAARTAAGWAPYSEAALGEARTRGAVFVDFTAAWCVTCQVNKRTVLETEAVKRAFADSGISLVRADWTQRDEGITRALARLGRSGVPVYAVYPAGGGMPELLPELLTRDLVLAALARATAR
jgi:thiol:disulfide interchange protein/DsbC/DsbD-like thiol-disulfide interchange protein